MQIDNIIKPMNNEIMSNDEINEFVKELEKELNKMELVKTYVIDRFEGNLVVCENRDTKEMININKKLLPQNIKEGSIIKYSDNKYEIDEEEEKNIDKRIKEKMKNLWNN